MESGVGLCALIKNRKGGNNVDEQRREIEVWCECIKLNVDVKHIELCVMSHLFC